MSLDPKRIEEVFTGALQQDSDAERAAFLETTCAGDVVLRERVESLLRAYYNASQFLDRPAVENLGAASTGHPEALDSRSGTPEQTVTVAENDGDSNALDLLQPSTKPGALGRLGHYEVQEIMGQGSFGTVFKAFDEKLHRVVAIKVLSQAFAASGAARKRFIREARAAAAIKDEHVIAIYDVHDEEHPPYLVMELCDGSSLQDKLAQHGSLSLTEIVRIGLQTAEGLSAAHKQGLVHRDIKPANILLENGVERVKITDFGLARAVDDASVTQSGTIAGTPLYMSPEQAEGLAVDHRSDLFSLGTVLYVMCTGRPPFRGTGTMAVLRRVIDNVPRPIREINTDIPQWLCDLIAKLHAKNPDERFQSAKEVAELLAKRLANLQTPGGVVPPVAERAPGAPRSMKRRWALAGGLLAVVSLAVGTLLALNRNTHPPATLVGDDGSPPLLAVAPFKGTQARAHQEAWARHLGMDVEITNALGMKLRLVPAGEFPMGTPPETLKDLVEFAGSTQAALPHEVQLLANEGAVHPVRLTRPFYLASYEVTYAQFRQFVKATNYVTDAERSGKGGWSNYQGQWVRRPEHVWRTPGEWVPLDNEPVVHITWNDAVAFCRWLSRLDGWDYVLPTEAQWEFAARAGTTDVYPPGGYEQLFLYAWTSETLGETRTHRPNAVGQKKANAFGLYDMLGNVWEYCSDRFAEGPKEGHLQIDPAGPAVGAERVVRGGAWYRSGRVFARYSMRLAGDGEPGVGMTDAGIGFRVAIAGNLTEKCARSQAGDIGQVAMLRQPVRR